MRRIARECTRIPQLAALPGLALFVVLWLATGIRLDYSLLVEDNYGLMQYLGREVLINEPISALFSLHMQPPMLNALAAVDLWVTPQSHLFLAGIFLLMTLASLYLMVDVLRILSIPFIARVGAGGLFAALPSTVIYSLWSYNTTPTLFGASLAVWGVAVMKGHQVQGSFASSLGVLVLVLTRSAFLWVFALAWIGALVVLITRHDHQTKRRSLKVIPSLVVLLVVLSTQAHYFNQFGLLTMSSWSGENLAKALIQSGKLSLPAESVGFVTGCQDSLLQSLRDGEPPLWDPVAFRTLPGCNDLPRFAPRASAAWNSPEKSGNYGFLGNLNWSEELVAAKEWQKLMIRLVITDPTQVIRMALSSETGSRESGLGIYLGPAEDYSEVTVIQQHHPLADIGGVLSLFFAPVALFVGALGLLKRGRGTWSDARTVLWFSWALIGYHIAVSTLAEYGEGMRFQAEITSVLMVVFVYGLWVLVGRDSKRSISEA